jgi:hypothetical protein
VAEEHGQAKVVSEVVFTWIEELVPKTWIKDLFSDFPKCNMLLNNHSKVYNGSILESRDMPSYPQWKLFSVKLSEGQKANREKL